MNTFVFDSQIQEGEPLLDATQGMIKDEPMMHKASYEFAWNHAGVLTQRFLFALPDNWKNNKTVIDSRGHMLMEGWYPCIPGWHHDDIPRDRSDKQPDYAGLRYKAEHCMAIWGGNSLTEFAIGRAVFPEIELGKTVYEEYHRMVEDEIVNGGQLRRVKVKPCVPTFFDWQTWHQGTPATGFGFRFFIRATRNTDRKPDNEIRRNANVYMPAIMGGW